MQSFLASVSHESRTSFFCVLHCAFCILHFWSCCPDAAAAIRDRKAGRTGRSGAAQRGDAGLMPMERLYRFDESGMPTS